jgi:hypothetical protein
MNKELCGPRIKILLMKNKLEEDYDLNFEEFDWDLSGTCSDPVTRPTWDLLGIPLKLDQDLLRT